MITKQALEPVETDDTNDKDNETTRATLNNTNNVKPFSCEKNSQKLFQVHPNGPRKHCYNC